MIIKFYDNGWNYYDNVTNVKWLNKQISFTKSSNESGSIFIPENLNNGLDFIILEEVEKQLQQYNDEYCNHVRLRIEDSCYDTIKNRAQQPYIKVLCFDYNEDRYCLIFSGSGYLLNNNGQTIEKIG